MKDNQCCLTKMKIITTKTALLIILSYILFVTKYCTNTDKKFQKNSFTKKDKKVTTNYAH